MYCFTCEKQFYVKRNFLSLFETKKYYICDSCRKKYPIQLHYEEIPLENYSLYIVSIFRMTYNLCFESYGKEISYIVLFLLKRHKACFFIFQEHLHLTDYFIEFLSLLADAEKKDILFVCCEVKK